jgi:hypothetical protein
MSRINPLDDNPIIETDYLTGEPLEVARQTRELYYQQFREQISPVEALHNQDQAINTYMWSYRPCNKIKNNTDFIMGEEKKEEENPFITFLRRNNLSTRFRRPLPFNTDNSLVRLRQEPIELPPRILSPQRTRQQQRQSRFDRNRQLHK